MLSSAALGLLCLFNAAVVLWGLRSAWRNGVVDGYGFAMEPANPGYVKAGDYLKSSMRHRWSTLSYEPDYEPAPAEEQRISKLLLTHTVDQLESETRMTVRQLPLQLRAEINDACRHRNYQYLIDLFATHKLYRDANIMAMLVMFGNVLLADSAQDEGEADGI